ncbi:metal-dependent hydrolase [Nocardia sp. NPDC052566]|uniref:metal-dependent hydrolase n=1 Tax=Nocardia sp. NPDC052566 TaxID=3364330 RepID=UPI0037C5D962
MVMGPTHAMSGAAAGMIVAELLPQRWGGPSSIAETFVWGGVCAGAALLPDLDLPHSTVARAFGTASQGAAKALNTASALFYRATRTPTDNHRDPGHRTLTHTLLFAVTVGAGVSALIAGIGKPIIGLTLFLMLGLALRGLASDWTKQVGPPSVMAATAALTAAAWISMPAATGSTSLGLMITIGCITHCLGDGITKEGIPFLAPFVVINGKRWWEFALPSILRIRANGTFEKLALLPGLTATTAVVAVIAVAPAVTSATTAR